MEGIEFKGLRSEEGWRIVKKEGRGQRRDLVGWGCEKKIGI